MEDDYTPPNNYNYEPNINPSDVMAQSSENDSYNQNVIDYSQQRYAQPRTATALNPFAGYESAFSTPLNASRYASQQRPQTPAQGRNSLIGPDMDFYVNKIGDVNAGLVLSSSKKGIDVFGMEQPFEYTQGYDEKTGAVIKNRFHVVPAGFSSVPMEDGTVKSIDNYTLAKTFGVKTVPFKGGEAEATNFRLIVQKYQQFTEQAERLRAIYKRNTYLGPMDPSKDSAEAEALENQMVQTFQFILNGAKMSGSGSSDMDTGRAEQILPRRAGYTFTHLGGNELAKLDMALEMARTKIDTVAQDNGMMLLQPKGSGTSGQKAPPGAKKIRN